MKFLRRRFSDGVVFRRDHDHRSSECGAERKRNLRNRDKEVMSRQSRRGRSGDKPEKKTRGRPKKSKLLF